MNTLPPEVTVIIPAYNQARYIGSTIETVQRQTFPAWELFIVDDGSTDNTAEVVRTFLEDKRIHYTRQQNQERAVARVVISSEKFEIDLAMQNASKPGEINKALFDGLPKEMRQYSIICFATEPNGSLGISQIHLISS